jgi:hypothetical protein
MSRLVKRPEIVAWLNTTPKDGKETWGLVGNGMTSGSYSYEASETSETYIVDENATTTIDNYNVSLDGEMKCLFGDEVYDYINGLRYNLAVGSDAVSQVLLVDKYDVDESGNYKAQKFNCSVSVSSYGGEGGTTPTIGFRINVNGRPENGSVKLTAGMPEFTKATE